MFNPLNSKYDKNSAHINVYAGAGGDDAKDWARMLFIMYLKYAARRGWKTIITDDLAAEIYGEFSYGFLKKESGVHRLVRISPFSSKKLRHTSFALMEVVPILPDIEGQKIVIPENDLKIDTFRSSGPGGQNVQKVETAVRVTHVPTGVVVACQSERSQQQNKEKALRLLKSKLVTLMIANQQQEISALRVKVKPEWGNQIRSYVLHPYKLVKDHRTKIESSQPDKVLEGDLDKFIEGEIDQCNTRLNS